MFFVVICGFKLLVGSQSTGDSYPKGSLNGMNRHYYYLRQEVIFLSAFVCVCVCVCVYVCVCVCVCLIFILVLILILIVILVLSFTISLFLFSLLFLSFHPGCDNSHLTGTLMVIAAYLN
jgi:hypothetical protein